MIRLAIYSPEGGIDTTSFFRAGGPYGLLRKQVPDLAYSFATQVSWNECKQVDVVLFQRPYSPVHVEMLQKFRYNRIPVMVDYDDLLTDVSPTNPAHSLYSKPEIQEALAEIPALADVITVSTSYLQSNFNHPNVIVIPNAWDDYLFSNEQRKPTANKALRILWRGSPSHTDDLNVCADSVLRLSKEHPEYHWFFLGMTPWFARQIPASNIHCYNEPQDIAEYMESIKAIAPDIMMVPLLDTPFNRAKSNIAWMEGAYAGAVVIAPSWEEWKRPGIINYGDSFHSVLSLVTASIESYRNCPVKAWDFIQSNLKLSQVNISRYEILRTLIEKRGTIPRPLPPIRA
jgi:hypothetical protein